MLKFYKLAGWTSDVDWTDGHMCTYGLEDATEADAVWFEHDAFLSGDYVGSGSYARSNVRVFREMFPEGEGTLYHVCHGSYGSEWIRFDIAALGHHEMRKVLDGLDDYPLIDEGDHSDLECDDESEAWENYGKDDFRRALRKAVPHHADLFDHIPDDALWMIWREMCDTWNIHGGTGCEHEPGGVCFFFNEIARPYRHLPPRPWSEIRTVIQNGIFEYRRLST